MHEKTVPVLFLTALPIAMHRASYRTIAIVANADAMGHGVGRGPYLEAVTKKRNCEVYLEEGLNLDLTIIASPKCPCAVRNIFLAVLVVYFYCPVNS